MMPQLMASGASNILLVGDTRMTALALTDGSILPQQLGRDYMLFGPPQGEGVFHPKIILQLGREGGRALVGSANATAAGLGGNVELMTEIECGAERSPQQDYIRAIWSYIEALTANAEGAAGDAIAWATQHTPWLTGPQPDPVLALDDGSLIAFFARPGGSAIGTRFIERIDEPVDRLIVLSPYWDDGLAAIGDLKGKLDPARTTVLLDVGTHDYPPQNHLPDIEIVDISSWQTGRFKHAKLIVARTANYDHILSGSANCTSAALGAGGSDGINAEACVYRRVAAGEAVASLNIDDLLGMPVVELSALPLVPRPEPIALAATHALRPGRFEIEHGSLRWTPPDGVQWAGRIVLLDAQGHGIDELAVDEMTVTGTVRHQRVDDASPIYFAKVVDGEITSTIAPVVHRAELKAKRREPASRSVASAAAQFAEAGDLQLFLLQALDELQRADTDEASNVASGPARGERSKSDTIAPEVRILSYDDFVAQRTRAGRHGRSGDNSLAGSHADGVRDLLNRLSGSQPSIGAAHKEPDDGAWMDLGDEGLETAPADNSLIEAEVERTPAPVDKRAFERAVKIYETGMRGGSDQRSVGAADVLRLRFWLMLLLHAARAPKNPGGLPNTVTEDGWPRMAVRIIAAFFYPNDAPIARLVVEGAYEDMPVDFLECWATVLWVVDRLPEFLVRASGRSDFLKRLPLLRARIVERLGLTADDFIGEVMARITAGLDGAFAQKLGINT